MIPRNEEIRVSPRQTEIFLQWIKPRKQRPSNRRRKREKTRKREHDLNLQLSKQSTAFGAHTDTGPNSRFHGHLSLCPLRRRREGQRSQLSSSFLLPSLPPKKRSVYSCLFHREEHHAQLSYGYELDFPLSFLWLLQKIITNGRRERERLIWIGKKRFLERKGSKNSSRDGEENRGNGSYLYKGTPLPLGKQASKEQHLNKHEE